jgi:hypothetical protein
MPDLQFRRAIRVSASTHNRGAGRRRERRSSCWMLLPRRRFALCVLMHMLASQQQGRLSSSAAVTPPRSRWPSASRFWWARKIGFRIFGTRRKTCTRRGRPLLKPPQRLSQLGCPAPSGAEMHGNAPYAFLGASCAQLYRRCWRKRTRAHALARQGKPPIQIRGLDHSSTRASTGTRLNDVHDCAPCTLQTAI